VVLTRDTNSGVGPCVTQRAAIGQQRSCRCGGGHFTRMADRLAVAASPYSNLLPTDPMTASSRLLPALGSDLRGSFLAGTGEPVSSYDGVNGINPATISVVST